MKRRVLFIELLQRFPDQRHGVAQVGPVVGKEKPGLLVDHRQLYGRRSGVNTDVHRRSVIRPKGRAGYRRLGMTGCERVVLLPALKQRGLAAVGLGGSPVLQPAADLI